MSDALLLLVWFASGALVAALCLLDKISHLKEEIGFFKTEKAFLEKRLAEEQRDNDRLTEQVCFFVKQGDLKK